MNKFRLSLLASALAFSGTTYAFDHPTTTGVGVAFESAVTTDETSGQALSSVNVLLDNSLVFHQNRESGLSAGDSKSEFTPWGAYTYSETNAHVLSMDFSKDGHNFLFGFDRPISDTAILGMSFGVDTSESLQNGGTAYQDRTGFIFAPYFGAKISDSLILDATVGFASYDNDWYSGNVGDNQDFNSQPVEKLVR